MRERSESPDLVALVQLNVVLVDLQDRIDEGHLGGTTPALLDEAKRLAGMLRSAVAATRTCLPAGMAVRAGAALDALDALHIRIESAA